MPPASPQDNLISLISSLSSEQQRAVEAFVLYLQKKSLHSPQMEVRAALDEFIREHSELLRRLAQ